MIDLVNGGDADLLGRLRAIRACGNVPLVGDPRWPSAQWDAVAGAAAAADLPDDTAWATLTSGSSGSPRLVLRSAASWADSFDAVSALLDAGPDDSIALPAPASASLTLFSLAHALADGPRPTLGPASRSDADCLHGTPQALRATLDRLGTQDQRDERDERDELDGRDELGGRDELDARARPRLRAALVGGSHLDPGLRQRAEAAGIRVTGYYGAAELSFVAVDTGDGLRPFPGVELSIRRGELWVRSPFVASGYAGGPGPLRQDGEWATIGDRAELVDGRLRLLGRSDDAILSASATIVPEEVEAVLRSVPGVRDAIVFGMPRALVGALVAAYVELDGGAAASLGTNAAPFGGGADSLRGAVDARLTPAHRPRRWFAGELPRTTSGKPARAEAVRRVLAGEVPRLVV